MRRNLFGRTGVAILAALIPLQTLAISQEDAHAILYQSIYTSATDGCNPTATPLPQQSTVDQKIGSTFIVGFDAQTTPKSVIEDLVTKYRLGGIYLTDTTDASGSGNGGGFTKSYFDKLNSDAGSPLFIASDEEGAKIHRFSYPNTNFPTAKQMGGMSSGDVQGIGKDVGTRLKALGVTLDLAPVLDIDSGRNDGVDVITKYDRSFSSNPSVITDKAGAFAKGLEKAGVGITLKHFPGLGLATGPKENDTDEAIAHSPSINVLKKNDLKPYQALIKQFPDAVVMMSNENVTGLDDNEPASVSPAVVNLLRKQYNFKGLITTDDLNAKAVMMQTKSLSAAVVKSLQAGVTMPLFGELPTTNSNDAENALQSVIDAVKKDVPQGVLDNATQAIMSSKNSQPVAVSHSSSCCSGAVTGTGDNNPIIAYNELIKNGFNSIQAAGMVGNMVHESIGVEPERLQNHITERIPADSISPSDDSLGWGIVQWTPLTKFVNPVEAQGKDPNNLMVQVDHLTNELKQGYGSTLSKMKAEPSAAKAAEDFNTGYEQSADQPGSSAWNSRMIYATAVYENVTKGTPFPKNMPVSNSAAGGSSGGGSSSPSASSGSSSCGSTSSGTGDYKDPLRDAKGVNNGRIDQGVDYTGTGPVYAMGDGVVDTIHSNEPGGWPGGTFIRYKLSSGPAQGKLVYVAEDCTPKVSINEHVTTDTVLCTMFNGSNGIETGWANTSQYGTVAMAHDVYQNEPDGYSTNFGQNFSQLMNTFGHKGVLQTKVGVSHQPLPAGWPQW